MPVFVVSVAGAKQYRLSEQARRTMRPVAEGTAFAGVRAYQRLAGGDTLELVHLPEGVDPELLPPLPAGRSQLTRQTPEGWLVMRAPVSLLELEQLLERLEAGR